MKDISRFFLIYTLIVMGQCYLTSGQFANYFRPCHLQWQPFEDDLRAKMQEVTAMSKLLASLEQDNIDLKWRCLNELKNLRNQLDSVPQAIEHKLDKLRLNLTKQIAVNNELVQIQTEAALRAVKFGDLHKQYVNYKELEQQHNILKNNATDLATNLSQLMQANSEKDEEIQDLKMQLDTDAELFKNLREQRDGYRDQVLEKDKQIAALVAENENQQLELQRQQIKATAKAAKLKELETLLSTYSSTCPAQSCQAFGNSTAVHVLSLPGVQPFEVLCNGRIAGEGWTVVQRRLDGSVDFSRNWTDYRDGFGMLSGEFFLGLEKLHQISAHVPHELYIELEDFENEKRHARYDNFLVGSADEDYALKSLGNYSGNAGDSLRLSLHAKFSTYDQDNDADSGNCANRLGGGWWFFKCGLSNLNGRYLEDGGDYDGLGNGIFWDSWLGWEYSLKSVHMMIRPSSVLTIR